MKHRSTPLVATLIALLALSHSAHAGTVSNGSWSPSTCGARPEAPALNLKNIDTFNASTDAVNNYRVEINTYLNCLIKEANTDIQAVSASAKAAQQAARDANDKIEADVKAANEKFK
jgi:hypothetical protein